METEVFWKAVQERDARFDGAFVFGVKTTGIFCRPSCRAKAAKRENVEFFEEIKRAELSGFRACLKCRPKKADGADPQAELVIKALKMIEADTEISLEEISGKVGISLFHFQRVFKEFIGISPKKYAEAKRMENFKGELSGGSDVVTAMYEAGYGSSRGLYEKAVAKLGMTPAIYKKGGKGMNINYIITECELGKLLVARTSRGICSVTFGDSESELKSGLEAEFPNAEISKDDHDLGNAVESIIKYLAGKNKRLVLPLDLQATSFQLQVWDLLRKIPYGETRSYTDIAQELGDKKKVRAVARACATNRVALVVPCHRVVASDGKLSGYRWGLERKSKLLAAEKES